ncbi:hypothetical protein ABPG75_009564 [Micractinium tetrahymenae]
MTFTARALGLALGLCLLVIGADASSRRLNAAEVVNACSANTPKKKSLKANSKTAVWGYYFKGIRPALVAKPGDEVFVEMVTHHAGDDYAKMIKGDPGLEDIYRWTQQGQTMFMRGAEGGGQGVHVLTGPIHVCGSEPGDVLQAGTRVDILSLSPRKNPRTGKSYGSNAAAGWGYQFRAGFRDNDPREVITIYEVTKEGGQVYVKPDYQFRFAGSKTG